jgi:hypothetical protein
MSGVCSDAIDHRGTGTAGPEDAGTQRGGRHVGGLRQLVGRRGAGRRHPITVSAGVGRGGEELCPPPGKRLDDKAEAKLRGLKKRAFVPPAPADGKPGVEPSTKVKPEPGPPKGDAIEPAAPDEGLPKPDDPRDEARKKLAKQEEWAKHQEKLPQPGPPPGPKDACPVKRGQEAPTPPQPSTERPPAGAPSTEPPPAEAPSSEEPPVETPAPSASPSMSPGV